MASSDETYARLQHFLRELYQILEAAVALAVADCAGRGRQIDDSFLAAYVRDETKGRLRELQGTPLECEVKALNNGGVQVIHDGCALRVRKERDGGLPIGQSEALRLYYEQVPLALVWPGQEEASPVNDVELNLVVLWDFDSSTESLAGVDLVLPDQWRLAVPHPATAMLADAPEVDYEDVNVEFTADDDIALEHPEDEEEEDTEEETGE